jgi:hypothetical protein
MRLRKNSNGAVVLFHERPERRRRSGTDDEITEHKIISVRLGGRLLRYAFIRWSNNAVAIVGEDKRR